MLKKNIKVKSKPKQLSKKNNDIINVYDPKTGTKIDEIKKTPIKEIKNIYKILSDGQIKWSNIELKKRKKILLNVRDYLHENIDDLAETISKDNGKSKTDALVTDIFPADMVFNTFVKKAEKYLSDETINLETKIVINKRSYISYQPRGPVAVISPWNYPFSYPFFEAILSLLCGNTVLLKGSPETVLVSLKVEEILRAGGVPEYAFQNIIGGKEAGEEILNYPWRYISFTGSTETGKRIMSRAAENLTPVKMELGGKDPMIVLSDANLERASNGAVWSAFMISGQSCASVERVYVMKDIADKYIDLVVEKTKKLRGYLDSPEDYEIGPITAKFQYDKILKHIKEAKQKAKILTGGEVSSKIKGWYIPPTVITNVDHSMNFMKDETFGPLLPIMRVESIEEAINLANDSDYGLTASVWTKNLRLGKKIAGKINAGTVTINDHLYTQGLSKAPWLGARKNSGFGISKGIWGIRELTQIKHINYDIFPLKRNLWWFPTTKNKYDSFKAVIKNDFIFKPNVYLKFIRESVKLFKRF
ncbi:MAG: aldehyde dehydrogenase family protein [Spirochaetia bacterium]|nr:aldehyde dehydrogenase family protein [Spirochaetia bacterium]